MLVPKNRPAEFADRPTVSSATATLPRGTLIPVKLVRAVAGEIFDVVVDLRRSSPAFGKWEGYHLSAENKKMIWIPAGLAHGFAVLSEYADFLYKTTGYWAPQHERTLLWNDPDLAITWPLAGEPILAAKDRAGKRLSEAEVFD